MNVILFGSTGMIGQAVLRECLADKTISKILVINRKSSDFKHQKLVEIVQTDLFDISNIKHVFAEYSACFFCLGISSAGMTEAAYKHITYDLTLGIAKTLVEVCSEMSFCYISGAATDSTEKGKIMWARVKGKTENDLLALPFKQAYMFRPGYIQPLDGIKSKTRLYNALYFVFKPFYFLLKHSKNHITDTRTLGKAMISAVTKGYDKHVLEIKDINEILNS